MRISARITKSRRQPLLRRVCVRLRRDGNQPRTCSDRTCTRCDRARLSTTEIARAGINHARALARHTFSGLNRRVQRPNTHVRSSSGPQYPADRARRTVRRVLRTLQDCFTPTSIAARSVITRDPRAPCECHHRECIDEPCAWGMMSWRDSRHVGVNRDLRTHLAVMAGPLQRGSSAAVATLGSFYKAIELGFNTIHVATHDLRVRH